MVTPETLTDETIREWEKREVARLASPGLRRKVAAISAAALGQAVGVELSQGDPVHVRVAARQRICDAINARETKNALGGPNARNP